MWFLQKPNKLYYQSKQYATTKCHHRLLCQIDEKFVLQTKTLCNVICNNHMYLCCYANWQIFVVLNHNKYISYEHWNLQIYKIKTLRNTKYWDTHRSPSHCNQLSRGTPLTRCWFMPALNTQRFATVLTHQLKCFSHTEYHCNLTMYQFDVKPELQSVCKENLKFNGFPLLSHSHTSIDMHRHAEYHCLSIWCANWDIKWSQTLTLTGFNFFPE